MGQSHLQQRSLLKHTGNAQDSLLLHFKFKKEISIPVANKFSGLSQIDSSSLEFPLGGDESSFRSVLRIHDSSERGSQQRGKPKCEEYMFLSKSYHNTFLGKITAQLTQPSLFYPKLFYSHLNMAPIISLVY